jgi:hypothetical protein
LYVSGTSAMNSVKNRPNANDFSPSVHISILHDWKYSSSESAVLKYDIVNFNKFCILKYNIINFNKFVF